ncbi:MAG: GDP-mannose 4,6-dehydratase [Chlamydiales bacterium]
MKAIVTGGAGFIGSYLTELLLELEHEVMVIDNLHSGRLENLDKVKNHPNFFFHKKDICALDSTLFQGVDWVFHLAGVADIVPSVANPRLYYEVNVHGTFNLLECLRNANVKRLIYAASSSCYGIPTLYPTPETAQISPEYPYALTKYLGEKLVLHWEKVYHIPAISLRLFNVYGLRSRATNAYGAVFSVFLTQKAHKMPFTVVGDGTQSRDFIYVTDVARAFVQAASSRISGEVFNVGSGKDYSINALVELLGGEVTYLPKRPGEPDCTCADISKIKRLLNWEGEVLFEEGVSRMLTAIQEYKDLPLWNSKTIQEATKSWFDCLCSKNV